MSALGLPAVPSELKSITPFLQRAEEVKKADPIIAYWCTYYAAQLGIALKLKDSGARSFLLQLLDLLEQMKTEIGPNDAIDDESASSAYVENFALRVFAGADNEDRKGNATRGTAKKFLAAANFLEVLNVFTPNADGPATTINVPEKIRYAKWKAADIAKAFREGRKPTPGGADETPPTAEDAVPSATSPTPSITDQEGSITAADQRSSSPGTISNLPSARSSLQSSLGVPPQGFADPKDAPMSPSAWSTLATPGTPGDSIASGSFGPTAPKSALKKASVSEELEGRSDDDGDGDDDDSGDVLARTGLSPSSLSEAKSVRFTPSVSGGLTPSVVQPEDDPFNPFPHPTDSQGADASAPEATPSAPESTLSAPGPDQETPVPPEIMLPPSFMHTSSVPSTPPPPPPVIPSVPSNVPPLPPPALPHVQPQPSAYAPPPGQVTARPLGPEDLTPALVTRIQKHCRFAISAMDYEDTDTARKELRAALALLGG